VAFTGKIAEVPIGLDGLTGTKNMAKVGPTHLIVAENVTYEAGTLGKEGGSSKYNSSAITSAPTVLGGHDWHPTASQQRLIVVTSNGKMLRDTGDGSFGTTLKTGLTVSSITPVFVGGGAEVAANNRKLFCYTGSNQVQVLSGDGTTTSDLATPPSDWGSIFPTFGLIHENRHWGGGNSNDPHRLYFTAPGNHEVFTGSDTGSISVYSGEGERITGAVSFKGVMVVWKYPSGIYIIDTSNADEANWSVDKHSSKIGGVSPLGHTPIDDDVMFIDQGGSLHLVSAIGEFANIGSRNLSDVADLTPLIRDEINLGELQRTQCTYYIAKREVHFTLSSSGTAYDRRLVVDLNRIDLPRFRLSTKDTNRSIWLRQDSNGVDRPMTGDASGFAWYLDQASRAKDGAGYNGKFQTPHLDFGWLDPSLGTKNKNGKFIELVVEPKGNWDLSVDVLWDDVTIDTLSFNMGVAGSSLGSFVLNTDKLAGGNLVNKRKRMVGSGRRLSLVGRNSGNGQDFSVSKFYCGFTEGSDRG
tara:strand:- start:418 stop:1995 length:1578 start_codon:yes stop_codon:yes gene_type:complete